MTSAPRTEAARDRGRVGVRVASGVVLLILLVAVAVVVLVVPRGESGTAIQQITRTGPAAREDFPAIAPALGPVRTRILTVARTEYGTNAPGVTFSEGESQPWCANFVSTTMRTAGIPFENPTSGSWRIPGVATLTDYYRDTGRWSPPDHRPTPGDVVLYDRPSPLGQHTNIVVERRGDLVTTVGGNERQGVTLRTYRLGREPGIQGYGLPPAGRR